MGCTTQAYLEGRHFDDIIKFIEEYTNSKTLVTQGVAFRDEKGKPNEEDKHYYIAFKLNGNRRSLYLSSSVSTNREFVNDEIRGFKPKKGTYTLLDLGMTDDAQKLMKKLCEKFGGYYIPNDCEEEYQEIEIQS